MSASCAIRGSFFDFVDDPWKHAGHEDRAARFVRDGLLVVRDGVIGRLRATSPTFPHATPTCR